MASPVSSCAQCVAEDECFDSAPPEPECPPSNCLPVEYDFVERPSQDFFCPVSLELLLEPQLTSCCGHHLSLEVATRLQRDGKACPMCNAEGWGAVLDKYHRRKAHQVRVRCWHNERGCEWEGEINGLERHADSCEKRPWECEYCGLKCCYEEGGEKHWPECLKFPELCPNGCEVGSVERCGLEQHRSVCPLEPVACEMKEFGCSVVVPRKELATHMRESELQHLTAMTALNLHLTRQLQQDSTERDRKIEKLVQDSAKRNRKIEQLQQEVVELKMQGKKQNEELAEHIQRVHSISEHIEQHTGLCIVTLRNYNETKTKALEKQGIFPWLQSCSEKIYSCFSGYALQLTTKYYSKTSSEIGSFLGLVKGENDDQLQWPVKVKVQLQLLNQAGDHHHVERTETLEWKKNERGIIKEIDASLMKYVDLEKRDDDVQYMMNDCLKFRIHVTIM